MATHPIVDAAPAARAWAVRVPSIEKVVFRGSVSHDAAGLGTGTFVYPAPSALGLLAAIVTHGMITSGMRQQQKDKMQLEADQVLQPFAPVLGGFTNRQLMESGLTLMTTGGDKRLIAATDAAGADWLIESAPVLSMTQDQRALVLDNVLRIYAPADSKSVYAQTIRVVSVPLAVPAAVPAPVEGEAAPAFAGAWLEGQGQRLTRTSAALFAESLDVALADLATPAATADVPHRTFRYFEGGNERMERAQPVSERCGRALIRTLRGWLMSIPVAAPAAVPGCAQRPSAL